MRLMRQSARNPGYRSASEPSFSLQQRQALAYEPDREPFKVGKATQQHRSALGTRTTRSMPLRLQSVLYYLFAQVPLPLHAPRTATLIEKIGGELDR
jgi:hypothetical protein